MLKMFKKPVLQYKNPELRKNIKALTAVQKSPKFVWKAIVHVSSWN